MSNTATCSSPALRPAAWQRLAHGLSGLRLGLGSLVEAHRARAQRRAEWRALRQLSDATLRDIGMTDRTVEPRFTLGVMDHERGRWG